MNVDPARRKVAPAEFVLGDEVEYACVDLRPQRFDRVPHKRIAPMLVAVQKPDLQRHALAGERPRQSSGLDDDAIVDHRGYRMRGVLVAQKLRAFIAVSEAPP